MTPLKDIPHGNLYHYTVKSEPLTLIYVYIGDRIGRQFNLEDLGRHGQAVEFQEETRRERENRSAVVINLIIVVLIIGIKYPSNM
jgi:hypothetical protein